MTNGIMATQTQTIDADTAELIIEEFGHTVVRVSDADVEDVIDQVEDADADLVSARAHRSSRSWVTLTTVKHHCLMRSVTPALLLAKLAVLHSTSVPIR